MFFFICALKPYEMKENKRYRMRCSLESPQEPFPPFCRTHPCWEGTNIFVSCHFFSWSRNDIKIRMKTTCLVFQWSHVLWPVRACRPLQEELYPPKIQPIWDFLHRQCLDLLEMIWSRPPPRWQVDTAVVHFPFLPPLQLLSQYLMCIKPMINKKILNVHFLYLWYWLELESLKV